MRIAVAGLGFMGTTHAQAWTRVDGAELYAVVSSDARKLAGNWTHTGGNLSRPAQQADLSRTVSYRNYAEALADPLVDAVDFCIPTDRHAEACVAALRAGKHVLVEKPLALRPEDADWVVAEARTAGRVLMAGHVLRFMPAYVEAKERLTDLGPVRNASFRRRCATPNWSAWLRDPARSGGGAFDLLIHDVDYVRWLFGMPEEIHASVAVDESNGVDLVTALLSYHNHGVSIAGGWHGVGAYPFTMDFTIVCERGSLEYCCHELILYRAGVGPETISLPASDPFEMELAHFHDCVARNQPSQICPASESADAVRLMRQILSARR